MPVHMPMHMPMAMRACHGVRMRMCMHVCVRRDARAIQINQPYAHARHAAAARYCAVCNGNSPSAADLRWRDGNDARERLKHRNGACNSCRFSEDDALRVRALRDLAGSLRRGEAQQDVLTLSSHSSEARPAQPRRHCLLSCSLQAEHTATHR